MPRAWFAPLLLALAGCQSGVRTLELGAFTVSLDRADGTLDVDFLGGASLDQLRFHAGDGSADVEMQLGSFRFSNVTANVRTGTSLGRDRLGLFDVADANGDLLGLASVQLLRDDALAITFSPLPQAEADRDARVGFSADCGDDPHFLGTGLHQNDVDHVGEAFPLWVSEPGIGKVETDEQPEDWFLRGTRHASAYPMPFLLRPERAQGLLLDTTSRVDVDLCHSDPTRFSLIAWDRASTLVLMSGTSPVQPVQTLSALTSGYTLPPPWVFGPWNDAIFGSDRVREVAAKLRAADAPSSVIWTEDWKGGADNGLGYRLKADWFLDRTLYPDAEDLAATLEANGFQWLGYFSPFVKPGTATYDDALEAGVVLRDTDGEPYLFTGVTFEPTGLVDLSTTAGQDWAAGYLTAALDLGFDGWMADYAEWLPVDAQLGSGRDALIAHNTYPLSWQLTNQRAVAGRDASFFVRSGWTGSASVAPVVWGGDQRTSFQADDGLPTVVAMGIGAGASGVPVFTHDVAGYNSVGNPTVTKELFFRWAALGAFSPILRTHHGAFSDANHQFDSDDETLAYWAHLAREHTRLFPYRYGLAAKAAKDGTPMLLSPSMVYGADSPGDWGRMDAWLLGDSLLVAPVLEAGATTRDVALPASVRWFDWWTGAEAQSGTVDAPIDYIPVFAAEGSIIPTFDVLPDTLLASASDPELVTLTDADATRRVYVFGAGGSFTEADGTRYTLVGTPTQAAEASAELDAGTLDAGGAQLQVQGAPRARRYTVVVVP